MSVAYKQVAIPVLWEVADHKGNATALEHTAIIKKFVAEFGVSKIQRVYGDREFGSAELFKYLISEGIDFHIRLKTSHLTGGLSFKRMWKNAADRVKLRGKVKVARLWLGSLCQLHKVSKGGKNGVFDCGKCRAK